MNKQRLVRSLSLFLAAWLASWLAAAADLSIKVVNLKSADGNVRVGLFDASNFPKKQLFSASVAAKPGDVTVTFKDVPAGTYAASAFQDVNDNKKLDTSAIGRPTEPFGFSRDAQGTFGPPSFDAASFSVKDGANSIELKLN